MRSKKDKRRATEEKERRIEAILVVLLLTQCVGRALRAQCAGVVALRAQEVLMMVQCMSQV